MVKTSITAISNGSGTVTQINAYDDYGIPQGKGANGVPFAGGTAITSFGRFGYTGQAWLPEAGLYHYKNRAYSPTQGRFMQADPIGYEDGVNLYAYVGGDPINLVDPLGLEGERDDDEDKPKPTIVVRGGQDRGIGSAPVSSTGFGAGTRFGGNRGNGASGTIGNAVPESESTEIVVTAQRLAARSVSITLRTIDFGIRIVYQLANDAKNPNNKCGSGPTNGIVPDRPGGYDVASACATHDSCYASSTSRQQCDANLGNDVRDLCRQQGGSSAGCLGLGVLYYRGVRRFGRGAYDGSGNPN